MTDAVSPIICPNCGRSFDGDYCPSCGQEAAEPRRPVGGLVREAAGDVLGLDARLWRTLWPLFRRPGFLTREYFAGRRARYVSPFRLYVFTAILFFAVMAATGGGPLRIRVESSGAGTALTFGQDGGEGGGRIDLPPPDPAREIPMAKYQRWLSERVAGVEARPDDFNAAVFATMSNIHFLLVPIFALLMRLFWRRRYYVEHLVLGMHAHAFLLLVGSVFVVLATVGEGTVAAGQAMRTIVRLGLMAYLFVAVRRMYGGRWWTTALKVLVFSWLYVMAATLVVVIVAFATLAFF